MTALLADAQAKSEALAAPTVDAGILHSAIVAAPALLGCTLVVQRNGRTRAGTIVETEAYLADDPASHAFAGPTDRNRAMFEEAGRAYVYRIHRCVCFNVVTGPRGRGEAVLVRAVAPVHGVRAMQRARALATTGTRAPDGVEISNGPGKLCQALGIGLTDDGAFVLSPRPCDGIRILARRAVPAFHVSPRIGISAASDLPLRFAVSGSPWVSRPRPRTPAVSPA